LLFGKNLPDVAKKFGRHVPDPRVSTTSARRSISPTPSTSAPSKQRPRKTYSDYDDLDEISAPKFQRHRCRPTKRGAVSREFGITVAVVSASGTLGA